MYVQLLFYICAALLLILLAKRYPIPAAIIYTLAVIYFVGFSSGRIGLGGVSIKFPLPFWRAIKSGHYGLTTNRSVLNVVLFVPYGYILPALLQRHPSEDEQSRKAKNRLWQIVGCGFLSSLIIETSQLIFRFGVFELDDLVKNTLGAAIGYRVWKMIM